LQHISQHIAGADIGRRTNHVNSDAELPRPMVPSWRDTQTGVFARGRLAALLVK